jgi:hypothetical protein
MNIFPLITIPIQHVHTLLPTYHLIAERETSFVYSCTCIQLESHLKGISPIARNGFGEAPVPSITFDDGHASQHRYALPLLQKHGIKAIFFSIAGWVDQRVDYMTSAQLRELISLGHDVQSHGYSHRMLTRCSDSELVLELTASRTELEQKLGTPVDALSIPFGRWDSRVLQACCAAGYKKVYTSDPYPVIHCAEAIALRGRFMVRRSTTECNIQSALHGRARSLHVIRVAHECKKIARRLMGEDLYHCVWGLLASRRTLDEVSSEYAEHKESE